MKNKIYLAPLEGVTDSIYRRTFAEYYGGVDKYFTPFLSPNSTYKFTTREFKEIDPKKNDVTNTVPQLLTNNAEHFLWAAGEIAALGFKEINFNLGCPSGTVVAKKKGSGLLYYPEDLERVLDGIFSGLDSVCAAKGAKAPVISIKTRLGKAEPEEFYEILEIYNKYPISELTIHPRIQSDFYREPIRPDFFEYALTHSKAPLVFNGEIKTVEYIETTFDKYPGINGVMLGRGLIANPELALAYQERGLQEKSNITDGEGSCIDMIRFKAFHDDLLSQYIEILSGEKPVLHRLKEFWGFWAELFPEEEKTIKKIRKANKVGEYKSIFEELL
ncbi:tRNA-dihydrouridine synthase [Pseudobutyrivibrio sp. YE44]|uniref:tRNA dihydrouridine synthase n=1 Tax=Pseudobutyrivibrio sp. YE44 TaxID=1520802 RepID=UPI000887896B|nr:tRNA-dihydrouridine synthase family protein [Pseudobutyrivibrio sp. YE44]SDB19831.1 tRNA-dihydrouridine synthase [Pseudobutyrivibrio sp. YE44]